MSRLITLISTTAKIPGYTVEAFRGLVTGNIVNTRHIGSDFVADLRGLIGGEVKSYTMLLNGTRQTAIKRMQEQATNMGADGVVEVRMTTATLGKNIEIVAYGTAVTLKKV